MREIVAVEQSEKSVPYYQVIAGRKGRHVPIAIVLGNERVVGLPKKILNKADKILEIPMRGAMVRQAHHPRRLGRGKESLNVSVVFGIIVSYLIFGYNRY